MKTIKILICSLIIASSSFLISCNDFLDVGPEFTQDAETFFNSKTDYELALFGAYDLLQSAFMTL